MAGPKQNHYKKGVAARKKIEKRERAEERQNDRNNRSTEAQILILKTRPGNSTREIARLTGK